MYKKYKSNSFFSSFFYISIYEKVKTNCQAILKKKDKDEMNIFIFYGPIKFLPFFRFLLFVITYYAIFAQKQIKL